MSKFIFSETDSLSEHNRLKDSLNSLGIPFEEKVIFKSGIKEMLSNFLVLQRPATGLRRGFSNQKYVLLVEKEDEEKAKKISPNDF